MSFKSTFKKANFTFLLSILLSSAALACGNDDKPKKDTLVTLKTSFGDIELVLFDQTPLHKKNFLKNVASGFYDGTTFHRIIKGFMIQGGDGNSKDADSTNDGMGSPGYTIPAEFVPELKHIQGALAAARMGDGVNPKKESSGSQFYIVENPQGAGFLDMNYTVFGQVLKGISVVETIANQPKNGMDRPYKNITIKAELNPMKRLKVTETYGFDYATNKINPLLIKK